MAKKGYIRKKEKAKEKWKKIVPITTDKFKL